MITFGDASGQPMPFGDMMMPLAMKGLSLIGSGGSWARPGRAAAAHDALVRYVEQETLRVIISASYPLARAAEAHRAVGGRGTMGKVALTVAEVA